MQKPNRTMLIFFRNIYRMPRYFSANLGILLLLGNTFWRVVNAGE